MGLIPSFKVLDSLKKKQKNPNLHLSPDLPLVPAGCACCSQPPWRGWQRFLVLGFGPSHSRCQNWGGHDLQDGTFALETMMSCDRQALQDVTFASETVAVLRQTWWNSQQVSMFVKSAWRRCILPLNPLGFWYLKLLPFKIPRTVLGSSGIFLDWVKFWFKMPQ